MVNFLLPCLYNESKTNMVEKHSTTPLEITPAQALEFSNDNLPEGEVARTRQRHKLGSNALGLLVMEANGEKIPVEYMNISGVDFGTKVIPNTTNKFSKGYNLTPINELQGRPKPETVNEAGASGVETYSLPGEIARAPANFEEWMERQEGLIAKGEIEVDKGVHTPPVQNTEAKSSQQPVEQPPIVDRDTEDFSEQPFGAKEKKVTWNKDATGELARRSRTRRTRGHISW